MRRQIYLRAAQRVVDELLDCSDGHGDVGRVGWVSWSQCCGGWCEDEVGG